MVALDELRHLLIADLISGDVLVGSSCGCGTSSVFLRIGSSFSNSTLMTFCNLSSESSIWAHLWYMPSTGVSLYESPYSVCRSFCFIFSIVSRIRFIIRSHWVIDGSCSINTWLTINRLVSHVTVSCKPTDAL